MKTGNRTNRQQKIDRLVRVFTPFIILLVGLTILNLSVPGDRASQKTPMPVPTMNDPQPVTADRGTQSARERPPIATAIANAPTSSPVNFEQIRKSEPTSSPIPIDDVVKLAGPPDLSIFSLTSPLSFYWNSERALGDDQVYALYLRDETGEILVGQLDEPNLGIGFQVQLSPDHTQISQGSYQWEIRLIQEPEGTLVGVSEQRSISFK